MTRPAKERKRDHAANGHARPKLHVTFDGRLYVDPDELVQTDKFRSQLRALEEIELAEPGRVGAAP